MTEKLMKVLKVASSEPEVLIVHQGYNPSSIIRLSKTGRKGTPHEIAYISLKQPVSVRDADDLRLKMAKKYELQDLDEDNSGFGSFNETTRDENPINVSNTHPIYIFSNMSTQPPPPFYY